MDIIKQFRERAKANMRTIVLPEGEEERVIKAAEYLNSEKLVKPILLGNPEKIGEISGKVNVDLTNIEIMNPEFSPYHEEWSNKFYELRKHKNLTKEEASATLKNELFFGAFVVREGLADGAVAGSINTTGNVLRAGIQVVGLAPNVSVVSSSFIMALKDGKILCRYPGSG
jgi:phosphate acetyltransferase